jgi:hypothetical protein
MVVTMDEAAKARRLAALQQMALVVLLERAGGRIAFTETEYQAVVDRHGGAAMMAIHAELLASPGENPDEAQVSLITKVPGQGDRLA